MATATSPRRIDRHSLLSLILPINHKSLIRGSKTAFHRQTSISARAPNSHFLPYLVPSHCLILTPIPPPIRQNCEKVSCGIFTRNPTIPEAPQFQRGSEKFLCCVDIHSHHSLQRWNIGQLLRNERRENIPTTACFPCVVCAR